MCNHMYHTRDIFGRPVKVPCGSCVTCRRTQSTFWSHRIQSDISHLEKSGAGSSFVTLTIESDTTPILRKSDLQKFFKRLRKSCPAYPFKYLAIGDYGENTFRPHYHALLIGFPPELSAYVRKNWSLGFVDVDAVCTGNVNYVVRYMQAQTPTEKAKFARLGLQEPFSLTSQGIGQSLFDKCDNGYYRFKGVKYKIPLYWQGKLNVPPQPADLSRYIDVARRNGFSNPQAYLEYKSRVAEECITRSNRNKLKPAQGIKHTLDKFDYTVVSLRPSVSDDIF